MHFSPHLGQLTVQYSHQNQLFLGLVISYDPQQFKEIPSRHIGRLPPALPSNPFQCTVVKSASKDKLAKLRRHRLILLVIV